MLDEIKEFEQYTTKPFDKFVVNNTDIGGRIKYNPFLSKAKGSKNIGIKRPMIIVARYYMFQNGTVDDDAAENALLSWLGKCSESEANPNLFNWLPDYINHLKKVCNDADKANCAIKNLENSKFTKDYYIGNTENEITVPEILDEAYRSGPLKRYYLFTEFKKDELMNNIFCNKKALSKQRGNTGYDRLNQVLKTVSAYLLKKGNSEQHRVPLSNVDICNWLITPTINKFDAEIFHYGFPEGPQIIKVFKKESEKNKIGKYYILKDFIEKFKIVENNDYESFTESHPGWNCYSDPGAGDNLRYKKYEDILKDKAFEKHTSPKS